MKQLLFSFQLTEKRKEVSNRLKTNSLSDYQKLREGIVRERIADWQEEGGHIKKLLLDYDWDYRKKICVKCPLETQQKLRCFRVNNFKDGIQESHCKKMDRARTQKYRKNIMSFINFHPLRNII